MLFFLFNDKNLVILTDLFSSLQLTVALLFPAGAGEGDGGYGHWAHEKEPKCLRPKLSWKQVLQTLLSPLHQNQWRTNICLFLFYYFALSTGVFLGLHNIKNEGGLRFYFVCLFLSGKLRVFINDLLLEIFWYNEAFTINVLLHDTFIRFDFVHVYECVRAWRVSGFQDFYLHTELLFSTGSPFSRFQELRFLREPDPVLW